MAERKADIFAVAGTLAGLLKERRDGQDKKIKQALGKDSDDGAVVKVGKTYRYVPQGTNGKRK